MGNVRGLSKWRHLDSQLNTFIASRLSSNLPIIEDIFIFNNLRHLN